MNIPNNFQGMLDNNAIYVGETCGHNMGMALDYFKEAII